MIIASNKKAYYDYHIIQDYEAGIKLVGSEVKSIRAGNTRVTESFIYIEDGQVIIKNMYIAKYSNSSNNNHEETRDRILLLKKNEIAKIAKHVEIKGNTIIALDIHTTDRNLIKLKIAVCKGKKEHDKRESLKERDVKRQIQRQIYE